MDDIVCGGLTKVFYSHRVSWPIRTADLGRIEIDPIIETYPLLKDVGSQLPFRSSLAAFDEFPSRTPQKYGSEGKKNVENSDYNRRSGDDAIVGPVDRIELRNDTVNIKRHPFPTKPAIVGLIIGVVICIAIVILAFVLNR